MNTNVEYKRPGRNRYCEYQSVTFINQNNVVGHIKISIVWFRSLGWSYFIELECWNIAHFILEHSNNKNIWKRRRELSLCAAAAEHEASEMLKSHGVIGLIFNPYILPQK